MRQTSHRERSHVAPAREIGVVRKPHHDRLRVALAFPNSYFVGMSNLGFQSVYRLFNAHEDVVCERAFLPPKQDLAHALESPGSFVTIESQTPVRDMDVLAFSVSFEWDYTNVVSMLRLAGLPIYAADRHARHPLVVVGGAVTFLNPEPLAPFADLIAAGEGEVLVPVLVEHLRAAGDRAAQLRAFAQQRGFYVPSLYEVRYEPDGTIEAFVPLADSLAPVPVRKAALAAKAAVDPPATSIFTPATEFGSRLLIEVVRGCANLCRFCWAGYNYLPVRAFPADRILGIARAARPHASRIGLVSIALCDHPDIERLLAGLIEMGYTISPASLRLDDLTDPLIRLLQQSGERSLTIAPEAGSDRLRRVINKNMTNEEILERADQIFGSGFENLKLYYMIGLPTETDDDLVAIRDLTAEIRERMMVHARQRGRVGRISASVNPLVPKPGTAYQWLPMEDPKVVEKKLKRLRSLVADLDNVYFSFKSERHSLYQALLSLGDRRIAPVVAAAERNGGQWRAALAETGVDLHFYVFRDRSRDTVLPWDIIDGGMKASFYRAEFEKGQRADVTLDPKRAAVTQP
ncbi:MAG: radical SAM protein [Acidobacteria bacterium]|nr:radical SAM protein [Acidobacteriota bacterium]